MNIRDFQYVVAVSELGHFGRAAKACHVSQPALSGQIKKLETHLGVTLFERTNRSVRTTAVGAVIVGLARELLQKAGEIEETAKSHADPFTGHLALGMIATIGPYLTPTLLPSVFHTLPALSLHLVESMTHLLEADLLSGQMDVAITATKPADGRLDEIPLYEEPFWIAVPSRHPLAQGEEVHLDDIDAEQLLLLSDGHCLRDQVMSVCRLRKERAASVNTQNTSLETILALVGAGAGVTLVPATALRGGWMTDSGIAMRREKTGRATRKVRLIFRRSDPRRVLLEKLADIICAAMPDTVLPMRR